jgi:hypothetical protein
MRKKKKYHFIYKTINLLSGKYYIGLHSSDDLEDGYLGSGRRLKYSINKYGKENHKREILEFCKSRSELKRRETEIVNLNEIAKTKCMNMKVGGIGGFDHITKKQRHINLVNLHKQNRLKKINSIFDWNGKKHSDKTKQKISKTKKNMGIGYTNSQYGTCWITNGIDNKKIYKGDEIPKGFKLGRKMK